MILRGFCILKLKYNIVQMQIGIMILRMELEIMKTLETERLILRPFEETDFEAVHAYASVAGV